MNVCTAWQCSLGDYIKIIQMKDMVARLTQTIQNGFQCSSCENGRHDMCQGKTGAASCDCKVCEEYSLVNFVKKEEW